MRKYVHPFLRETMIQTKDGSVYMKNWLYFRSFLPLEVDFTTNKIWKKWKKEQSLVSLSITKSESLKKEFYIYIKEQSKVK